MISKKIVSVITSVMVFCCVAGVSLTNVKADDSAPKSVDGSYLTSADSATGDTPNNERGKHLMDGQCSSQKQEQKESMPMVQQLLIIPLMRWQLLFM